MIGFPKPRARVLDRIAYKRKLDADIYTCRKAVRARDKGKCVIPGCRERSRHLHHIVYRSRGGSWTTHNICSLCVLHHKLVHAKVIQIAGNADEHLTITGDLKYLRFKL